MSPRERRVASGLTQLMVRDAGQGPPLVFLHAGVADSRMWTAQLEAFAGAWRAVAYDRRGFGQTDPAPETYSQVGDLLAVVEALGDGVVLVGCSQGGRVAIDAALARPDLVKALVLVAPAVGGAPAAEYPPAIAARLSDLDVAEADGNLDRVNALEAHLWLDGPLAEEGRVSGAARSLFLEMNGIALRSQDMGEAIEPPSQAYPRLAEISAPTLVVWGDLDFPHLQARCEHIARVLPNARRAVMPGAAHLPTLEQPEAFNRLLTDFLAELS